MATLPETIPYRSADDSEEDEGSLALVSVILSILSLAFFVCGSITSAFISDPGWTGGLIMFLSVVIGLTCWLLSIIFASISLQAGAISRKRGKLSLLLSIG